MSLRLSGPIASRPNPSSAIGALYLATDEVKVYESYGNAWVERTTNPNPETSRLLSGTLANRPAPGSTTGVIYYCTDTFDQYEAFPTAWFKLPSDSGGTPGGEDTQLQFNNGGVFGGIDEIEYNRETDEFTATSPWYFKNNFGAVSNYVALINTRAAAGATNRWEFQSDDGAVDFTLTSSQTVSNEGGPDAFVFNGGGYVDFKFWSYNSITFGRFTGYATMTINDVMKLTPQADPSPLQEGMVWAGLDHHLYYYNGTTKKQLDN